MFTGGVQKDEMMAAAMHAMQERKENMANMRKNRAYQELKREMDQKRRQREKVRFLELRGNSDHYLSGPWLGFHN